MEIEVININHLIIKLDHRCSTGVILLPLTQRARVRSPVRSVFLAEVFSGDFPQL